MFGSMLDTNVCIRAMRKGGEYILERLKSDPEQLCVSTIILNELYVGAELSARPDHHMQLVTELASRLTVLDFDDNAARHAADIRANLSRKGQLIGSNDMLIAGHARSLGLMLVTNDLSDFKRVDGLRCEDWLAETKDKI
jgi:tRNA(fMet)-specific endonuclease VapC